MTIVGPCGENTAKNAKLFYRLNQKTVKTNTCYINPSIYLSILFNEKVDQSYHYFFFLCSIYGYIYYYYFHNPLRVV